MIHAELSPNVISSVALSPKADPYSKARTYHTNHVISVIPVSCHPFSFRRTSVSTKLVNLDLTHLVFMFPLFSQPLIPLNQSTQQYWYSRVFNLIAWLSLLITTVVFITLFKHRMIKTTCQDSITDSQSHHANKSEKPEMHWIFFIIIQCHKSTKQFVYWACRSMILKQDHLKHNIVFFMQQSWCLQLGGQGLAQVYNYSCTVQVGEDQR